MQEKPAVWWNSESWLVSQCRRKEVRDRGQETRYVLLNNASMLTYWQWCCHGWVKMILRVTPTWRNSRNPQNWLVSSEWGWGTTIEALPNLQAGEPSFLINKDLFVHSPWRGLSTSPKQSTKISVPDTPRSTKCLWYTERESTYSNWNVNHDLMALITYAFRLRFRRAPSGNQR